MSTYEHGLDIVFHLLRVICRRIDIFRDLDHILLIQFLVLHQECVAHGSFSEGVDRDVDFRVNLTLLKERFLPVDLHTLILHDEPGMADRVENLSFSEVMVKFLDI